VPVRSSIAYLAYEKLQYSDDSPGLAPKTAWRIAVLLFLILAGGGFAKQFVNQKKEDRGAFLGIVWWRRDVHAFILLLAAVAVLYGWFCDTDVSHFVLIALLADVVFGVAWRCRADVDCDVALASLPKLKRPTHILIF